MREIEKKAHQVLAKAPTPSASAAIASSGVAAAKSSPTATKPVKQQSITADAFNEDQTRSEQK